MKYFITLLLFGVFFTCEGQTTIDSYPAPYVERLHDTLVWHRVGEVFLTMPAQYGWATDTLFPNGRAKLGPNAIPDTGFIRAAAREGQTKKDTGRVILQ